MADTNLPWAKSRTRQERQCLHCKEVKPAGDFYAYKYVTNQGKLSVRLEGDCKVCAAAKRKETESRTAENEYLRRFRREHPEIRREWSARRRAAPKPVVEQKQCNKCGQTKPAKAFYRMWLSQDGLNSQCRKCMCAVAREHDRTSDPEKLGRQRTAAHLRARYGMTLEEYEYLASAQNNRCLICDCFGVLLDVDHCHKTGRIRGLLCHLCNTALGALHEDIKKVAGMMRYIEQRCV